MPQLIAIRYADDWVLVSNFSLEQFYCAPAPTASQVLTDTWDVIDV